MFSLVFVLLGFSTPLFLLPVMVKQELKKFFLGGVSGTCYSVFTNHYGKCYQHAVAGDRHFGPMTLRTYDSSVLSDGLGLHDDEPERTVLL